MQPEGANAQRRPQVPEQLAELGEHSANRRHHVRDLVAWPLPGEQVDRQRHEHEEHREQHAEVQEGFRVSLAAEIPDDHRRQPQRGDVRDLSTDDASARENRLGLVVRRHLRGQRLVRDDFHRVHQLEEAVGDQVVPEGLAFDPHEREGGQQRNRQQDEEPPASEPFAEPAVVEVVGDVTDDRREERVQQACGHEDDAGFRRRQSAVRRVEVDDPGGDDRHRAGAQEVVASIGDVVSQPYRACGHQVATRLNSPSARMAMAWP